MKATSRIISLLLLLLASWQAMLTAKPVISWLTCDPGTEIYELEGHSALRVRDVGIDMVVNWGLFDFATPAFAWRFALGETDYMAGAVPTNMFVEYYTMQGRQVREQILDLDSISTYRLLADVHHTLQPANCTYRYNYVLDNCATRPLAYIERASGLSFPQGERDANVTFRREMSRYHKEYPWYQLGIDIALGSGIDYPLTARECGFAPVEMERYIAGLSVTDAEGNTRPLVSATMGLNPPTTIETPASILPSPMVVALILLAVIVITVVDDQRRRRVSAITDSLLFGVQGLAGCLVAFLIIWSSHYATSPNYVALWLNPLAFVPAIGEWFRGARKVMVIYHSMNILALLLLLIIFTLGVQGSNPAFYPLMGCSALRSVNYLMVWKRSATLR